VSSLTSFFLPFDGLTTLKVLAQLGDNDPKEVVAVILSAGWDGDGTTVCNAAADRVKVVFEADGKLHGAPPGYEIETRHDVKQRLAAASAAGGGGGDGSVTADLSGLGLDGRTAACTLRALHRNNALYGARFWSRLCLPVLQDC
jgi:hypothetical protein